MLNARLVRVLLIGWSVIAVPVAVFAERPQLPGQQEKRETFDAASIKRTSEPTAFQIRDEPSGLTATNVTALYLITFAYGVLERVAFSPLSESDPMANHRHLCARLNRSA